MSNYLTIMYLNSNNNLIKVLNYHIIIFLIAVSLSFYSCSTKKKSDTTDKPNIVIILADDQGWGDLSATGNKNIHTPNVDLIAKNGATLKHFYVSPVCSPTRAELLTGRYHPRSNVFDTSVGGERIDLDETTIAEVFQKAGYATGAFGKWHNGMQYPYHPNARGFDEYYGFASGHWGNYFSPMLEHNGRIVKGEGYLTDDFTNKAMAFMEDHQHEPFFVYVPYNTPHSPFQVPDRWWNQFKDKELSMHHRDPEKEELRKTKAALAMGKNIDWNVGRIQKKLKELNLMENTILLYFSDNGPNTWRWNGGMKGRKGSIHEGGVRSPLFLQWPGKIKPGVEIQEISAAIDLLPTLTDLTGISIFGLNKPLDGKSLKPLLLQNSVNWQRRFLYSHWRGATSVRSQNFRLDHEGRLYEMDQDPGQYNDLAKENPEITKKLKDSLKAWESNVLSELDPNVNRPFTIGHPDYKYTQMPARDGVPHGNIERSDNSENCTFFTNWTSASDSITWNAEVLAKGKYKVTLYYTCAARNIGSTIELSFGDNKLQGKIIEPHDPPLKGMDHDRIERTQSYVKDWKAMNMGVITLKKGRGNLTLKALNIPGDQVMDFRLLMFKRVFD